MRNPADKKNCTEIGYVKKTHGVKGELQLFYQEGIEELLDELEYIFVDYEGLLVPFFIETVFSSGATSAIVQFDTLTSKEKASQFTGCKLFIETEHLEASEVQFSPQLLKGSTVVDDEEQLVGTITEVNDYGGNLVITIGTGKNEILLPFHEDLLLEFNPKKKKIVMELPEGLIGMNDGI
jgi:16S rRNA processing protein RimM